MLVYLPRYSPEFSPIELAFGWLKKLLRRKRRQDAVRMSTSQIANFVLGNLDKLPARKMRGFCRKCHWDVSRLAHTQADHAERTRRGRPAANCRETSRTTAQWWQAAKARIQDACGGAARICDGVLVT